MAQAEVKPMLADRVGLASRRMHASAQQERPYLMMLEHDGERVSPYDLT